MNDTITITPPPAEKCPCCGGPVTHHYKLDRQLVQAQCADRSGNCRAYNLIGAGDRITEAITDFLAKAGKLKSTKN